MIHETPVIAELAVEYATAADVFRLDLSPLDGADLLASSNAEAWTWTPFLAKATNVSITRGIARDGINLKTEAGYAHITLRNDLDFDPATNLDVRPNVGVRIENIRSGVMLFTGVIEDVRVDYDKAGNVITQVIAVDAVRDVANTPRYGAAAPAAEYEEIWDRFRRLLTSSPIPWNIGDDLRGIPDQALDYITFSNFPEVEQLIDDLGYPGRWPVEPHFVIGPPRCFITSGSNAFGQLTGLVVGHRYSLVLPQAAGAVPPPGGDPVTGEGGSQGLHLAVGSEQANGAVNPWAEIRVPDSPARTRVAVDFVAQATTAYVHAWTTPETPGAPGGNVYVYGFRLISLTPTYAANTVHESDLGSHLDIAAATARAAWFVDHGGVLQVAPATPTDEDPPEVYHFTDSGDGIPYTGVQVSFDTADLLSSVELQNHARAFDADQGAWVADDRNLGPWEDHTAAATYGQRRRVVETTIADVPDPQSVRPADLAQKILERHSRVRNIPRSLRWNASAMYLNFPDVDVWALIDVTHRGVTHRMRVLHITHEISPSRWMIDYTLKEA